MDSISKLTDTLLYFVPALLVLGAVYLMIKKFLDNEHRLRLLESKANIRKDIVPLRLQAYERMCLFLERISPGNLIIRVQKPGMSTRDLQLELLSAIRTEFEHNFSQQIYMSSKAWDVVKAAKEETVKIINLAASSAGEEATGSQLSKVIFEILIKNEKIPTQKALEFVKNEARQLF